MLFPSIASHRAAYFYVGCVCVFLLLATCGVYIADQTGVISRKSTLPPEEVSSVAYINLPRMTVSLGANGAVLASVDISLEVSSKDVLKLMGYQPRYCDRLNGFLLSVRPEQLQNLASTPWMRQEMLYQINSVGAPARVHDLFLTNLVIM